jgi:Protein of unknown function (DUF3011)
MRTTILGIGIVFAAAALAPFAAAQAREGGDSIECASQDYARQRCDVPWRDARLERQISDTRCVRGQTWGIDRQGLWVDRGCAGRFQEVGGHDRDRHDRDHDRDGGRADWQPDANWNQSFTVACESQDGRDHFCQVDLGGGGHATLERQLSDTRCIEGQNWGSNRAGVWVKQGCRAVFSIDRRWR